MMSDLETFAIRLAAEWRDGRQPGHCPVEQWLDRFALAFPIPEPDTCADSVSRLPGRCAPIRWHEDDRQMLGFRGGQTFYAIPWREIDAFLREFDTCEDDEESPAPVWEPSLPLAG